MPRLSMPDGTAFDPERWLESAVATGPELPLAFWMALLSLADDEGFIDMTHDEMVPHLDRLTSYFESELAN